MATLKTKETKASVKTFLEKIADDTMRTDCYTILQMMHEATGEEPKMWGSNMIGFGSYHYQYASGHEGDWFIAGFSPRKQNLTLYLMIGFEKHEGLMKKLGKHKTGKACLYLKRLADVDPSILRQLINISVETLRKKK